MISHLSALATMTRSLQQGVLMLICNKIALWQNRCQDLTLHYVMPALSRGMIENDHKNTLAYLLCHKSLVLIIFHTSNLKVWYPMKHRKQTENKQNSLNFHLFMLYLFPVTQSYLFTQTVLIHCKLIKLSLIFTFINYSNTGIFYEKID